MPHFSLGVGNMKKLFRKLRFLLVFVVLLVGCQQEENNVEQKSTTKKTEEKVQITKEEERSIQDVIHTFVRTTNEKNLAEHMELFSKKMPSAEDLKTQKKPHFKREIRKLNWNI